MTLKIDRRAFLQALIAAGASFTLPAKATKAQVDQVWAEAQTNPWFFEVNDHGTLVEEGVKEPETWGTSSTTLQAETSKSRRQRFRNYRGATRSRHTWTDNWTTKSKASKRSWIQTHFCQRRRRQNSKKIDALKALRDEYEEPWQDWIELEGGEGLAKFKELVEDWLAEPIDWMQSEWIPVRSGAQGAAFGFFEDQPYELLKELGVVIVDGEHPGSSYVAAELRANIEDANAAAERLGLPFRFKRESA